MSVPTDPGAAVPHASAELRDELPPALAGLDVWTDDDVHGAGLPVRDVPFVSVGGGMGSYITVDHLRVMGGVPAADIRVLSNLDVPWGTYERLTRMSQLGRERRIRSDSASRPDNLWGFPSYALAEAARLRSARPLLQVLGEPVVADFYTPVLHDVITGIEREARRIGYWDMLDRGRVRTVRRRSGQGWFTVHVPADGSGPVAHRSRDVHLAVGYSGLRYLGDLQQVRERTGDYHRIVNGYENHEHVYDALQRRPGTVLVRGSGVAAHAILQRLITDRECSRAGTRILHVFRNYVDGPHGRHPWSRRGGGDGFAYQGFNYPKSSWGGQLKTRMDRLDGDDLLRAYADIEGTTTPYRRMWQHYLARGRAEGWYTQLTGRLDDVRVDGTGVRARVRPPRVDHDDHEVRADFVIDCTGLDGDVLQHQVLGDLVRHGVAKRNAFGRLAVERSFALPGTTDASGRVYVTGAASYGGSFPGVDTFLGLQIAAHAVVDDLARRGLCERMGPLRSTAAWLDWVRDRPVR